MPYPNRDPGANPQTDCSLRRQAGGYYVTIQVQGCVPTEAESQQRYRRGHRAAVPGHADLIFTETRNGIPAFKPYARTPEDPAEIATAERAWQAVAEIQARLRGEPPPAPVAEPWNLPVCLGCGYRMRCGCPPAPEGDA